MSGAEVVQRTPAQELAATVRGEDFQSQLALALPEGIRQERFARAVATAILENPDLADPEKVNRGSVFTAVLKSAADGLVPDGREAALVVYGGKAQYLPMIGGFRKIAGESGWTIRTTVVHANDDFEVELGLEPRIRHVPTRPGAEKGDVVAAYAIGAHGDGRREVEVMHRDDIDKIRAVSRAKDRGPWVDWFERMCEKTVGKRLFAKLPLGDRERVERILEASRLEPVEAAAQMYGSDARAALAPGETVDIETGEIVGSGEPPQAEAVSSFPETASVPEDPEPAFGEPEAVVEDEAVVRASKVKLPKGAGVHAGKTLGEVAEISGGEEWLAWAARNPTSDSVGTRVHAALQHFRPGLFDSPQS